MEPYNPIRLVHREMGKAMRMQLKAAVSKAGNTM
jgi:hypothetical protein